MKNTVLIIFSLLVFTSCYYDNKEELYPVLTDSSTTCDSTTVSYSGVVAPIMLNSCAVTGCHVGSSPAGSPPLDLSNYNDVKTYGLNGQLMGRMNLNSNAAGFMPIGGQKLSDCDLSKINAWINAGAPNN